MTEVLCNIVQCVHNNGERCQKELIKVDRMHSVMCVDFLCGFCGGSHSNLGVTKCAECRKLTCSNHVHGQR